MFKSPNKYNNLFKYEKTVYVSISLVQLKISVSKLRNCTSQKNLTMEATNSSKVSVNSYKTTRHHNPEESIHCTNNR